MKDVDLFQKARGVAEKSNSDEMLYQKTTVATMNTKNLVVIGDAPKASFAQNKRYPGMLSGSACSKSDIDC